MRPRRLKPGSDRRADSKRTAKVVVRGHTFVQNLRAATTNSGPIPETLNCESGQHSTNSKSDLNRSPADPEARRATRSTNATVPR